jgi:N-acetyl-gamma-glutamyl-phosphate reductase
MKDSINIAIAGATGYVGLELIKLLEKHPRAKIVFLLSKKSVGKTINYFDKRIKSKKLPKLTSIKKIDWSKIDIIFSALPNGEAQKMASYIPNKVKLIDLSADFRIKNHKIYKQWYGINHKIKKVRKSIYAISEFSKKQLPNFNIISCPGCYPTSIQIPLIPLVKKKLINLENIIVDSKSGYSGAGKDIFKKFPDRDLLNSVSAYGVGHHKHMPEIDQELSIVAEKKVKIDFTPHLIPMFRGILSTIYLETKKNISARKIHSYLKKIHKKNFFVKIEKFNTPIGTDDVMNTNFCKISVCKGRKSNKIIIISTIDNLIKGAAGQAIQNMNLMLKFKESLGLK